MKKLLLLGLIVVPLASYAVVKTIGWDAPTTYENGDPLPAADISHYKIYYGTTSGGPYPNVVEGSDNATSLPVDFVEGNRVYVVVTCVGVNGLESDYSSEMPINLRKPQPPKNLFW